MRLTFLSRSMSKIHKVRLDSPMMGFSVDLSGLLGIELHAIPSTTFLINCLLNR